MPYIRVTTNCCENPLDYNPRKPPRHCPICGEQWWVTPSDTSDKLTKQYELLMEAHDDNEV